MASPHNKSANASAKAEDKKLDRQLKDSFPASDPPSYSGGAIGAPKARASDAAGPETPAVVEAEKKVKSGDAAKPETY